MCRSQNIRVAILDVEYEASTFVAIRDAVFDTKYNLDMHYWFCSYIKHGLNFSRVNILPDKFC